MRVRLNHKRLLELISQSKLSQNHWAIRLGLSRGHWSGIVNGKHPYPSKKTRSVLLDAFGVSFEELFTHESSSGADAEFQADLAERYLLEREIGQGGMGTVYLARDVRLGRSVALKVVSTEAVSGIGVDQFLKEIRFTARLQHPHILPVHDAGEAAGSPYYVMPLIEGGSLRRRLELDGPLSLETAVRITRGIAAALRHAHDRQVLHCDVKPENVLLTGDHAYVADFGIARAIHAEGAEWGRRSELDSSAGTPAYVSPEQATGEAALDARSDVYSLACLTYEMLAGVAPFEGRNTMEVVAKRFVEVPSLSRFAPHLPQAVGQAVRNGMRVHPKDRPGSSMDFAESLAVGSRSTDQVWRRATSPLLSITASLRKRLPTAPKTVMDMIDSIRQDVTYSLRTFRRAPLITAVIVLTLALGIGINSAVFTIVSGVLFKPLPYPDAERLVFTWSLIRQGAVLDTTTVNPADFADWQARNSSFTDMAAFNVWLPTVTGPSGSEQLAGGIVSWNFFDVVDVKPIIGSGFTEAHGEPGNDRVVILSYGFWQRRFGGDPHILERTIVVNGESHNIVGVMPADYRHLDPSRNLANAEFWAPFSVAENANNRSSLYLRSIARLRPGVAVQEAQTEMSGIAEQLARAFPLTNGNRSAIVIPLRDHHYASVKPALLVILCAAALVLLIICANIANLIMARSQSRQREFAIRTSLGAGKARLARQLIVEQTALALPGAMLGIGAVLLGSGALTRIQMQSMSGIAKIAVDWRVIAFSVTIALVVGIAFGILAVIELRRTSSREVLAEDTAGSGSSRSTHRFRTTLVVSQIGLAAALLISAGLLTKSFINLMGVSSGFSIANTMTFQTIAPSWKYSSATDAAPFFTRLTEDIASLPGVESVGMVTDLPFTSENRFRAFNRPEEPYDPENAPFIEYHQVDQGYFAAAGISLRAGRGFTNGDRANTDPVVLINEAARALLWPDQDVIGRQLVTDSDPGGDRATVVGLVSDVLDDGLNTRPEPRVYFSFLQQPSRRMSFLVHSTTEPEVLVVALRERVLRADQDATFDRVTTLEDLVSQSVAGERFAVRLSVWFSLLSLVLAGIGVYGLMAFVVGSRKREMGIRTALGAGSGDVVRLILSQSLRFTTIGILLGMGIAAAATRLLSFLLFGVAPMDPTTFLIAPALLAVIAVTASYIPARRASRISPMTALRSD